MDKEMLERAIKGNDMCREKYNCSECPYHGLHYCHSILCRESRDLLREQDEKIRQLRLALQIMNGHGIKVDTEGR